LVRNLCPVASNMLSHDAWACIDSRICVSGRVRSNNAIADLIQLNESIAKMLRRWQATLEPGNHSKTKGQERPKDSGRTKD